MQVYQIAERMVTPQTDITRLVDRLEAAGFVGRERCGEDRRVVWVTLTAAGKSVLKKLDRPVNELHEKQFAHLPAQGPRPAQRPALPRPPSQLANQSLFLPYYLLQQTIAHSEI